MKSIMVFVFVALSAVFCLSGLTACKSTGPMTAAQTVTATCPMCSGMLTAVPAKEVTYTKALCPVCQKQTDLSDTVDKQLYLGTYASVQVCDHCKAAVETCPDCRKSAEMK